MKITGSDKIVFVDAFIILKFWSISFMKNGAKIYRTIVAPQS